MRRLLRLFGWVIVVGIVAPTAQSLLLLRGAASTTFSPVYSVSFGAICDGSSHPLSGKFATLAAAQIPYPFVTSLTQQIDFAALKAMSNFALGADGSEHSTSSPQSNQPMVIQNGICELGGDEWLIRSADGMNLSGAGATATILHGSNANGVLGFDGLWYSQISNLSITQDSSGSTVALDVDGNVPGHLYSTFGVQANRFDGLVVGGGAGTYAFAMCRLGGSSGQCSENTFDNFHGSNANFSVYYQNGFNAIDNVFIGGDMQNYPKNAIYLVAGSVGVYNTSFESTTGYTQLANNSCDINASSAGAYDVITVEGIRSESLCIYLGAFSQLANLHGISQNPAAYVTWAGTTAYGANTVVKETDPSGIYRMYLDTTPGTSASSPPTWPASGTVSDGTITWTMTPFNAITLASGNFDYTTSHIDPAASIALGKPNASSCGSSPGITSMSSSYSGLVTIGSGSTTACTLTMANSDTKQQLLNCTLTGIGTGSIVLSITSISLVSGLETLVFASSADMQGKKVAYACAYN